MACSRSSVRGIQNDVSEEIRREVEKERPESLKNIVINRSARQLSAAKPKVLALEVNYVIAPRKVSTEEVIRGRSSYQRNFERESKRSITRSKQEAFKKSKTPKQNFFHEFKNSKVEGKTVNTKVNKGNATVLLNKEHYGKKDE